MQMRPDKGLKLVDRDQAAPDVLDSGLMDSKLLAKHKLKGDKKEKRSKKDKKSRKEKHAKVLKAVKKKGTQNAGSDIFAALRAEREMRESHERKKAHQAVLDATLNADG